MAVVEPSAGTGGCLALKGALQISECLMSKDMTDGVFMDLM